MTQPIHQQGTGEDIEEVDKGTTDVDGEHEHQIHHHQEDGDTQHAVEYKAIDPVRGGTLDLALFAQGGAGHLVDKTITGIGQADVDVIPQGLFGLLLHGR